MPKDYIGKRIGRIINPGETGFNNPNTPWGGLRNIVGWQKPDAVRLQIAGFFLIDRRMNPHIVIFKNAAMIAGEKLPSGEDPVPFESLAEALDHKQKMHLSLGDEGKVKPVALVPDPGFGNAKPDRMWVPKPTAKKM